MSIILIKHLFKHFNGTPAVQDVSFTIEPSQCFAFLGPNGSGKTTTMRMLYGSAKPDPHAETSMDVLGFDPRKNPLEVKAGIGIVPQEDTLDEELDVYQNLSIYSRFYRIPSQKAKQRIEELLAFMELEEKIHAEVRTLSGGMKRRLVIARSLINQPEVLILDEPTTGLDPQVRQIIWQKLRSLMENGLTILLTTHYMEEAYQIAHNIHILDKGKTIMTGNPQELTQEHMETHVLTLKDQSSRNTITPTDAMRSEIHEGLFMVYSNDSQELHELAKNIPPHHYDIRATTLEDLFLKITGRHLNE